MTPPVWPDTSNLPIASRQTLVYCWFAYWFLHRRSPAARETIFVFGRYKPASCPNAPNVSVIFSSTIYALKQGFERLCGLILLLQTIHGTSPALRILRGWFRLAEIARSADQIAGPTLPAPGDYKSRYLRLGGSHRHQSPDYLKISFNVNDCFTLAGNGKPLCSHTENG